MILTFCKMGFSRLPPLGWPWGRFRGWIHSSNFFSGIRQAQARLCTTTRSRLTGGFWVGGGTPFLTLTNFLLFMASHGVIPAGKCDFMVHVTPGYLALGVTRPLDPNLHPIWPKNGQNSPVSSASWPFDQLSEDAHGVIPGGIWVLMVH